MKNDEEDV